MSDGEVGIEIEAEDKSKKGFDSASKNAETFGKKMGGLGKALKVVGAAVVAFVAFKGLHNWMKESIRLASIQQDALQDLSSALRQTGEEDVAAATQRIADFASELQAVSTVGDEATIATAAMGVRFGLVGKQLEDTVTAATDIAAVLGQDVKPVMQALSVASKEGAAGLATFGIKVDQSIPKSKQFAIGLKMINEQFGGAAAAKAQTYSGAMTQLSNTFGDFREAIGAVTTDSKLLRAIIIELSRFIAEMTVKVEASAGKLDFMDESFAAIIFSIKAVIKVGGFLINVFKGIKIIGEVMILGLVRGFQQLIAVAELTMTPFNKIFDILVKLGKLDTNPLRDGIASVGEAAEMLAVTLEDSIEKGAQSMVNISSATDKAAEAVERYRGKVLQTAAALGELGEAGKGVGGAPGKAGGGLGEEKKNELEEKMSALDRFTERRIANIDKIADAQEAAAKNEDARLQEWLSANQAAAQAVAGVMTQAFIDIAMGSEDAGRRMTMAVIDAAQVAVMSYAASGAAASAFSQAGIPIIGPIMATVAAGIIFGLIKGYMAQIPKAAMGGVVMGGVPGVDSVGTLVQHGEGVLQRGQTGVIQRLADVLESRESAAPVAAGSGNTHMHYHADSVVPQTSGQYAQGVQDVNKMQKRLDRWRM